MMDYLFGGNFPSRSECGPWEPWLAWVNIVSHTLVGLAYLIIPAAMLSLVRTQRSKVLNPGIVYWFAAFIFLCGLTHLTGDVLPFFWAPYRFITLVVLITAVVSFGAFWRFRAAIRAIKTIPTLAELQSVIAERDREIEKRREIERELMRERDDLSFRVRSLEAFTKAQELTDVKRHEIAVHLAALKRMSVKPIPGGDE